MRYLTLTVMYIVLIVLWSLVYSIATMLLGYPKGGIPFFFFALVMGYSAKWCHSKVNVWFLARQVKGYK